MSCRVCGLLSNLLRSHHGHYMWLHPCCLKFALSLIFFLLYMPDFSYIFPPLLPILITMKLQGQGVVLLFCCLITVPQIDQLEFFGVYISLLLCKFDVVFVQSLSREKYIFTYFFSEDKYLF